MPQSGRVFSVLKTQVVGKFGKFYIQKGRVRIDVGVWCVDQTWKKLQTLSGYLRLIQIDSNAQLQLNTASQFSCPFQQI